MNKVDSFRPKLLSASEYVLALHSAQARVAVLVLNRARRQTTQRILAAEEIASPPFLAWLAEQNQSGADIFLGMNPIRADRFARSKEDIGEIRHVYLDLDENAGASLDAIRTTGEVPTPNFVLDTSPEKHQVMWRVEDLDQAQAESLLRSLANQFRGDLAATDISRVLRVPGFRNQKYAEHFEVRALQQTDQIYHLRDFAVYPESSDALRSLADTHRSPRHLRAGHSSQSEADWAYAKRALARGDPPEEVIRHIADYRADDKADPDYYARLTVHKAHSQLAARIAIDSAPERHPDRALDDSVPLNSVPSRED
jgi:RepB DNA-primase from phage plasmid